MPITALDRLIDLSYWRGDATALVAADRKVTFSELVDKTARTATAFQSVGIGSGDRIGLSAKDGIGHVIELFAVWSLGAVAVPLDFRTAPNELNRLVREFNIRFLILDKQIDIPGTQIIVRDEDWQQSVSRARAYLADPPPSEGDAVISLTSGTTGRPVGIVMSHAEHLIRASQFDRLSSGTARFASAGLMSFSAIRSHVMAHLLQGSEVHFFPPLIGTGEFAERILSADITNAFVVPTQIRSLLKEVQGKTTPLFPNMYCLWSGGSDLRREEKLAAHHTLSKSFLHSFASGVTGTCAFLSGDDLLAHPDTDGRVVRDIRLEVVDDDDKQLPIGEMGQVRVRGSALASRIIGEPRENGDRLRNGWAYTGDIGALDANRFLTIHGRNSDMIIRGGTNVYPAEVENVLAGMPGIVECAVVGVDTEREGQEIVAFAVVRDGVSAEDILAHTERELLSDKRPRRVIIVDKLPRNANGKVLRRELRVE